MQAVVKRASWKRAVAYTAFFACMFWVINFSPIGVAGLLAVSGGNSILDFEFGYNSADAFILLTKLGGEGRAFYLGRVLPLDFVFPVSYALCYAGWMAVLLQKLERNGPARFFLLVPLAAMLGDWVENAGIIVLLKTYPRPLGWAVTVASVAGVIKMCCIVASLGVLAWLGILLLRARQASREEPA